MKAGLARVLCSALLLFLLPAGSRAETFSLRNLPPVDTAESGKTGDRSQTAVPPGVAQIEEAAGEAVPKSKSKAILYSLLLPGWGHYYVGDKQGAATFLTIEAATWTTFIVFEVQGYLREEGYQDYAQVFAGISGADHSDDYYSVIAEFDSWTDYEESIKSEGRFALYPDAGAAALEEYFVEHRVSDYEPWVWKSADVRRDFRSNRSSSKTSYRRALYAVAVAAANRVASAFFVIKATNDANESIQGNRVGYHLEFGAPVEHPQDGLQTGVSFIASF